MARSSKEEIQDRALAKMDKINKYRKREETKPLTLAEQLANLEKEQKMPPAEKLKRMEYTEWCRELREFTRKERVCVERIMHIVESRHKKELESFHSTGTSFKEIGKWISEIAMNHL